MAGQTVVDNEKIYHDAFLTFAQQGQRSVRSGVAITENSPADMGVQYSSGEVYFDNTSVILTAGNAVVSPAHATLDRFDNVVCSNTGLIVVLAGTPALDRRPPVIDENTYCVLARIGVTHAVSQINNSDIKDLRTLFTLPPLNSDTTRVLKAGDTMSGVLTSPLTVFTEMPRATNIPLGTPRTTTSEVLTLFLATTTISTTQSGIFTTGKHFVQTSIKNHGPGVAYIDLNNALFTPTINNTIPIYSDEELIITDHIFNIYGGIASDAVTIVQIENYIADDSSFSSNHLYSNTRQILQIQGNGNYSGGFSALTDTQMRDMIIVCNGTSDIYVNFSGLTASSSNSFLIMQGESRIYNNINNTDIKIYSLETSEVRILGVGRV